MCVFLAHDPGSRSCCVDDACRRRPFPGFYLGQRPMLAKRKGRARRFNKSPNDIRKPWIIYLFFHLKGVRLFSHTQTRHDTSSKQDNRKTVSHLNFDTEQRLAPLPSDTVGPPPGSQTDRTPVGGVVRKGQTETRFDETFDESRAIRVELARPSTVTLRRGQFVWT